MFITLSVCLCPGSVYCHASLCDIPCGVYITKPFSVMSLVGCILPCLSLWCPLGVYIAMPLCVMSLMGCKLPCLSVWCPLWGVYCHASLCDVPCGVYIVMPLCVMSPVGCILPCLCVWCPLWGCILSCLYVWYPLWGVYCHASLWCPVWGVYCHLYLQGAPVGSLLHYIPLMCVLPRF